MSRCQTTACHSPPATLLGKAPNLQRLLAVQEHASEGKLYADAFEIVFLLRQEG